MEQGWFTFATNKTVQEVPLNPSYRETVLLSGNLAGQKYEGPCVVRAIKVSIPRLDICEYVGAEVAEASSELPDGPYQLTFAGRRMRAFNIAGDWRVIGFCSQEGGLR